MEAKNLVNQTFWNRRTVLLLPIVVNSLPFKPGASERIVGANTDVGSGTGYDSNLVDSTSSHTLVSKIKPCMSKYKSFTLKLRMAHYISHNLFDSPLLLGQP